MIEFVPGLLAVPSFSTLQSLRKSIIDHGNTCPLTQKHLVSLLYILLMGKLARAYEKIIFFGNPGMRLHGLNLIFFFFLESLHHFKTGMSHRVTGG